MPIYCLREEGKSRVQPNARNAGHLNSSPTTYCAPDDGEAFDCDDRGAAGELPT